MDVVDVKPAGTKANRPHALDGVRRCPTTSERIRSLSQPFDISPHGSVESGGQGPYRGIVGLKEMGGLTSSSQRLMKRLRLVGVDRLERSGQILKIRCAIRPAGRGVDVERPHKGWIIEQLVIGPIAKHTQRRRLKRYCVLVRRRRLAETGGDPGRPAGVPGHQTGLRQGDQHRGMRRQPRVRLLGEGQGGGRIAGGSGSLRGEESEAAITGRLGA